MLALTDAEIVVVATPSHLHETDSLEILQSKRHCVVEKPMATSLAGAQRMIDAAREVDRRLFVFQPFRFSAELHHLREIIDRNILGRIFEIRVCWLSFARRNDWQTLRKNGGGLLNNAGSHAIDMVVNLLDAPVVSLLADLQHIKDAGDCEDHVHLFLKAGNGRTADMTLSTACALPSPKWMLLGSCGTLSSDGRESTLRYYDPLSVSELTAIDGPAPERRYDNQDVLPWKEEHRTLPVTTSQEFYDNVAGVLLNDETMTVTPESVAETLRVMEWARKGTNYNHERKNQ